MTSERVWLLKRDDSLSTEEDDDSILPEVNNEQQPYIPDGMPPPYSASSAGFQTTDCEVCQSKVRITGNEKIVRCSRCNESTALKPAPAGKRFVRCSCRCLLICSADSRKICCPRLNCGKIIHLSPASSQSDASTAHNTQRTTCSDCHGPVSYNIHVNHVSACEHRHSGYATSSYAKREILGLSVAIVTILIIIIVVIAIHPILGLPVLWSALSFPFMIGRIIYLMCKKVEHADYETV